MPKQTVFALITFLHDLFTAVWIGGLITLGLVILPSAKAVLGQGPQTKKLLQVIQKRLSPLVYVSMVGLLATGLLLARRNPSFQGILHFGNSYSLVLALKHILVLAMILVSLYRSLVLGRRGGSRSPTQEKMNVALLLLNMILGIAILLLSGFSAAFASPPPV